MNSSKSFNIQLAHKSQGLIPSSKKLGNYAKSCGLIQRVRKITAENIICALIHALALSEKSSRAIAFGLGMTDDLKVSRCAVWKFLKRPAIVPFIESVLAGTLKNFIEETPVLKLAGNLKSEFSGVSRIILGDSTTVCLHPSLAKIFPGSTNQTDVEKAHFRVQYVFDLITGKPLQASLDEYKRNDMSAALDVISILKKGDLLIRDLGYASVASFKAIKEKGAYFLSRLKAKDNVYDTGGNLLNINDKLEELAPRSGMMVRFPILMTKKEKLPTDLVAIRVPEEVANERRRKLKKKHKEQGWPTPTKKYLERQSWTVMVTNLPEEIASNRKIEQLYLLRWRIEMVFKAAKSHTGLLSAAQHKTNQYHSKALLYSWLLMVCILANMNVFSMGRIREIYCPDGYSNFELEIHERSLFKMLPRYTMLVGFYLELAACGGDLIHHIDRTQYYDAIHNRTENYRSRESLSEVLQSVLELETDLKHLSLS